MTQAEVRVLELLVGGHTVEAVANELGLAIATVRTHLARVLQKTGTGRQAELVQLALQLRSPLRGSLS